MPYKNIEQRREHHDAYQKRRRDMYKRKLMAQRRKIGHCQKCGWNIHPEILEWHHKNKTGKKFSFSIGNLGNRSWKIIQKEINKCELICPNCHRWKHYKERKWFRLLARRNKGS